MHCHPSDLDLMDTSSILRDPITYAHPQSDGWELTGWIANLLLISPVRNGINGRCLSFPPSHPISRPPRRQSDSSHGGDIAGVRHLRAQTSKPWFPSATHSRDKSKLNGGLLTVYGIEWSPTHNTVRLSGHSSHQQEIAPATTPWPPNWWTPRHPHALARHRADRRSVARRGEGRGWATRDEGGNAELHRWRRPGAHDHGACGGALHLGLRELTGKVGGSSMEGAPPGRQGRGAGALGAERHGWAEGEEVVRPRYMAPSPQ
jgi:hypothetical protein